MAFLSATAVDSNEELAGAMPEGAGSALALPLHPLSWPQLVLKRCHAATPAGIPLRPFAAWRFFRLPLENIIISLGTGTLSDRPYLA